MDSLFSMNVALYLSRSIEFLSAAFVFALTAFLILSVILYVKDRTQKNQLF